MPIAPDRILYEDEHVLAVNKLSGELVVKGAGAVHKLPLYDFLLKDYPGLRVLHRLDFETSGVVLFAKTKQVEAQVLNTKFEHGVKSGPDHATRWKKTYQTLVMGRITRSTGAIRKKLPARGRGVVDAETLYTVLDVFANSTFLEAVITTGRFHQIRKHFAGIEHPLVLDKEYGHPKFNQLFKQELGYNKFFLHAIKLEFPHPVTGKDMVIQAPLPKAFAGLLKKLRSL